MVLGCQERKFKPVQPGFHLNSFPLVLTANTGYWRTPPVSRPLSQRVSIGLAPPANSGGIVALTATHYNRPPLSPTEETMRRPSPVGLLLVSLSAPGTKTLRAPTAPPAP